MAELKWTNVNDAGANSAMSNYLTANKEFRKSIMDIGSNLADFTNVLNEGDKSVRANTRNENTQAILNRMKRIQTPEEYQAFMADQSMAEPALREKYGWYVDMDKINSAQSTLAKDVYERAQNVDNQRDYSPEARELSLQINNALAKGDNATAQKLMEKFNGSISRSDAYAKDGYTLTKDIQTRAETGLDKLNGALEKQSATKVALSTNEANLAGITQRMITAGITKEMLARPQEFNFSPEQARLVNEYLAYQKERAMLMSQDALNAKYTNAVQGVFGLSVDNSSSGSYTPPTSTPNSVSATFGGEAQPSNQEIQQARNFTQQLQNQQQQGIPADFQIPMRLPEQQGTQGQAKQPIDNSPKTFDELNAQGKEEFHTAYNNLKPEDKNLGNYFNMADKNFSNTIAMAKQNLPTIPQVEGNSPAYEKIAKLEFTDENSYNLAMDKLYKEDPDTYAKFTNLITQYPEIKDYLMLKKSDPNNPRIKQFEEDIKGAKALALQNILANETGFTFGNNISKEDQVETVSDIGELLKEGKSVTINGKQLLDSNTGDTAQKKRTLLKAVRSILVKQGFLDGSKPDAFIWLDARGGMQKVLDRAIDAGVPITMLGALIRNLDAEVNEGNKDNDAEFSNARFENAVETLIKNKDNLRDWRDKLGKQVNAVTYAMNNPVNQALVIGKNLHLNDGMNSYEDILNMFIKDVGLNLTGVTGKPIPTQAQQDLAKSGLDTLRKYIGSSQIPNRHDLIEQGIQYSPEEAREAIERSRNYSKEKEAKLKSDPPEAIKISIMNILEYGDDEMKAQARKLLNL